MCIRKYSGTFLLRVLLNPFITNFNMLQQLLRCEVCSTAKHASSVKGTSGLSVDSEALFISGNQSESTWPSGASYSRNFTSQSSRLLIICSLSVQNDCDQLELRTVSFDSEFTIFCNFESEEPVLVSYNRTFSLLIFDPALANQLYTLEFPGSTRTLHKQTLRVHRLVIHCFDYPRFEINVTAHRVKGCCDERKQIQGTGSRNTQLVRSCQSWYLALNFLVSIMPSANRYLLV